MSGGHFDYKKSYLGYIAEQLELDIEVNLPDCWFHASVSV
jgi:hypothetical protein